MATISMLVGLACSSCGGGLSSDAAPDRNKGTSIFGLRLPYPESYTTGSRFVGSAQRADWTHDGSSFGYLAPLAFGVNQTTLSAPQQGLLGGVVQLDYGRP